MCFECGTAREVIFGQFCCIHIWINLPLIAFFIIYLYFCSYSNNRAVLLLGILRKTVSIKPKAMSALKDLYSPVFYKKLATVLEQVLPSFDSSQFTGLIYTTEFGQKELKERMRHTTEVLHRFLPADFTEAIGYIEKIIQKLREQQFGEDGLVFIFLPDYIETYGLDQFDTSMKAIEFTTQFVSCEFAVRPFLLQYGQQMLQQMEKWSVHESYKVRRLASEGSRPRLPWAMAIPALKKDPEPLLPLLENLKNDPSEWVRRSVANNLNDIAKDHPQTVLDIASRWKGISKETDAIIKHGCRTLLKKGHPDILSHYGLDTDGIVFTDFEILTPEVKNGEYVEFTFSINNTATLPKTVRLEYAVYYNKANGILSKKVFKISERIYQSGEKTAIIRRQSFRPITTRKYYTGNHRLAVIINGQEQSGGGFVLV